MRIRLAAACCCSRSSCRRAPMRTPSWSRARRPPASASPALRASSPCGSPSLSRPRSRAYRSSTGRERRRPERESRGPHGERAARLAPATRDRGLSHHLFDRLAGRSPRHSRGHRVRRRDRGSSGQGLRFADGRNEHHRERRAPLRPDVALAPDRHLRAARGRPAGGGALAHHTLRARRAAGRCCSQASSRSQTSLRRSRCGRRSPIPRGATQCSYGNSRSSRCSSRSRRGSESSRSPCSCPSRRPRRRAATPRRSARSRSSR